MPHCHDALKTLTMKTILPFLLLFLWGIGGFSQETPTDTTKKEKEKIKIITGKLNLGISQYKGFKISQRQNPFEVTLAGMPMIQYKNFYMPVNFLVSTLNQKKQQPFNYLGLIPTFNWGRFYIGDTFIDYSPYTLNAHRITGLGFDLYGMKHLRLGFLYGRMIRPIAEDLGVMDNPETFLVEQPTPAFARYGFAAKIGFAIKDSTYIDFLVFKAKDRTTSIPAITKTDADGLKTPSPAENLVIGSKFKIRLGKRLFWDTDMAASLYTRNLNAAPFEFETSENQLIKRLQNSPLKDAATINASSQLNYAAESVLSYWDSTFNFKLRYREITPNYKSLGSYNYFYDTDIRRINFASSLQKLKGKLIMNASADYEQNNITKNNFYTGKTLLGLWEMLYFPSQKFGAFLQYTGTSSRQTPVSESPTKYGSTSNLHNFSIVSRFTYDTPRVFNLITLTGMYNYIQNELIYAGVKTPSLFNVYTVNLGYNLSLLKKGSTIDAGIWRVSLTDIAKLEQSNTGINLGYSQNFLKNKASASGQYSLFLNQYSPINSGKTHQLNLNLNYFIIQGHKVWFKAIFLNNGVDVPSATIKNFSEVRTMVGYDVEL